MGTAREAAPGWKPRGHWGRVGLVDRVGAAICALLVAGGLCGCGSAQGSSADTAAVTEAAGGRAFASAVNIRVRDLSGAEVAAPESVDPSRGAGVLAFARCDGGVIPKRVVLEARSTLLAAGRGSLLVRSRVTLWPSEALASRNFAAFASELGSRCELRYGGTSVSRLRVALPGGVYARGLRVAVPSQGKHTGEIGYHDIVGFVCGPAEIVLTAAGFSRPVQPQTERLLLAMLYRRARDARSEI